MAKNIRRMLAMCMVLCMLLTAVPLQALAEETVETSTDSNDGVTTSVTTTTTTTTSGDNTTVTIKVDKTTSGTKESTGDKVSGRESSTTTTVKDSENKVIASSNQSASANTTVTTTPNAEGGNTTVETSVIKNSREEANGDSYEFEETRTETTDTNARGDIIREQGEVDGSEKSKEHVAPNVNVDVSLTDKDDPETEEKENQNTVKGDAVGTDKTDENAPDGTTTTVDKQGSVTVTTTDITLTETVNPEKNDMDYIKSDATANADNDLFIIGSYMAQIPTEKEDMPEVEDGYQYVVLGYGNSSQFYAGILYTTPATEDEKPAFVAPDGTPYYARRTNLGNSHKLEGAYINGEKVSDEVYKAVWANVCQYTMIDPATGEVISTYCADLNTQVADFFSYNMQNIEDGTYYTEEQAAMIRTVAKNGYWGVKDDPATEEPEYGSLESVKAMMRKAENEDGTAVFTEEEINALTDGIAMTATQYAIWSFSNEMSDVAFLNAQYIPKDENNVGKGWSYGHLNNIPESEQASVDLIFKLYNYLINMDPSVLTATTRDTIINEMNFLKDMSVTVLEKAEDHENNYDSDDSNDAYVTSLTFALMVTPSTENGDDLVVTVTNSNGETVATGRIAGTAAEGEVVLTPDSEGNYSFNNIVLTEGDQKVTINLDGVQNLEEGVYLYTSEIVEGTSSQTMVGVASGERGVNVSMDLKFSLSVDDEVIVTERVWHDEYDPSYPPQNPPTPPTTPPQTPPTDPEEDPEEDEPVPAEYRMTNQDGGATQTIDDEPVPLADAPKTGDESGMIVAMIIMLALGLFVVNYDSKKFKI